MNENTFETSKLFRLLPIAIFLVMIGCLFLTVTMAGDIRAMQEKQDSMGLAIVDIAQTVRAPGCVMHDYTQASSNLYMFGKDTDHPAVMTELAKNWSRAYGNGLLDIPHWISQ